VNLLTLEHLYKALASGARVAARELVSLCHRLAGNLSRGSWWMLEAGTIGERVKTVTKLSDRIEISMSLASDPTGTFSFSDMPSDLSFSPRHAQ
jgi:hypothetical protein